MRLFSNVVSRRFYSFKTPGKLTSTPRTRTTTLIAKPDSAPMPDAPRLSPLNKALLQLSPASRPVSTTVKPIEIKSPLFNMNALGIKPEDREWFTAVNIAVRTRMSKLDASHNYEHIRRVVSNAAQILESEKKKYYWARDLDPTVLWTTCMTHDIGDAKYPGGLGEKGLDQDAVIYNFLDDLGCPAIITCQVSLLAQSVSFTKEISNEAEVRRVAEKWPEFRVVQDADRLDGLGAIGVGRLFVYGGVDEGRRSGSIDGGIELIRQRFTHYSRLMKTQTGKNVAEERYQWMVEDFVQRWMVEADTSNV